jgi:hypothetical protein
MGKTTARRSATTRASPGELQSPATDASLQAKLSVAPARSAERRAPSARCLRARTVLVHLGRPSHAARADTLATIRCPRFRRPLVSRRPSSTLRTRRFPHTYAQTAVADALVGFRPKDTRLFSARDHRASSIARGRPCGRRKLKTAAAERASGACPPLVERHPPGLTGEGTGFRSIIGMMSRMSE